MRRLVIALVAASLIAGSTYAAATGLGGLQATDVAADTDTLTACDTTGVGAKFNIAFIDNGQAESSGTAGTEINSVTVSGIADACAGNIIQIKLYKPDGVLVSLDDAFLPNPWTNGAPDARFFVLDIANPKVKDVAAIEVRIDDGSF